MYFPSVPGVGLEKRSVGLDVDRTLVHGKTIWWFLLDRVLDRGRLSESSQFGLLQDLEKQTGWCQLVAEMTDPGVVLASASRVSAWDLVGGPLVLFVALANSQSVWALDLRAALLERASMAHEDARRSLSAEWQDWVPCQLLPSPWRSLPRLACR